MCTRWYKILTKQSREIGRENSAFEADTFMPSTAISQPPSGESAMKVTATHFQNVLDGEVDARERHQLSLMVMLHWDTGRQEGRRRGEREKERQAEGWLVLVCFNK